MSGASYLDIYNLALSYLDFGQRVQSPTEKTPQLGFCNAFYDRARKLVLEQCYWTFATRATALTLLVDQSTLTPSAIFYPGWRFAYQKPITALKVQAVTTWYGLRDNPNYSYWWCAPGCGPNFNGPYRPPWTEAISADGSALNILTDQDQAWCIYTIDPPNISILPEVFIDCVAWQLATLIAGPASANQKAKERALKMSELSLTRALAQNLNEQQPDPYPDSPSIAARR
jgi:hypothetical protein